MKTIIRMGLATLIAFLVISIAVVATTASNEIPESEKDPFCCETLSDVLASQKSISTLQQNTGTSSQLETRASSPDQAGDVANETFHPQDERPEPHDTTDIFAPPAPIAQPDDIVRDIRPALDHGPKPAETQKYIVLHDTEVDTSPEAVVSSWEASGKYVAAHFVIGKDGHIVQCVELDRIAHHAGYGDTGHNALYEVLEDGRDDMRGSAPIGAWASDYGMNAWSVGIELVHVSGDGIYPEAQLEALDRLILFIDEHFGFESQIIDHKAWRTGNSDTSPEFAAYLASYQSARHH